MSTGNPRQPEVLKQGEEITVIEKELKQLYMKLDKHVAILDEQVVYIGRGEHEVFNKEEMIAYINELEAAKKLKDVVNVNRRKILVGGLAMGAFMTLFGSAYSSGLRQLKMLIDSRNSGVESERAGFKLIDLPLGIVFGFLTTKMIRDVLTRSLKLNSKEEYANEIINKFEKEKEVLIRYCLPLLSGDQGKAQKFVLDYFMLVAEIANTEKRLIQASGKN